MRTLPLERDALAGLLELLPPDEPVVAWVREGEGLVGWGEADRHEFGGRERFSRAARWWQDWCDNAKVDDDVSVPGTGPVAFATFAFDHSPGSSTLVVPRITVGVRGDSAWITVVDPDEQPSTPDSWPSASPPSAIAWTDGTQPVAKWCAAVDTIIRRIEAGAFDKVVLARDVVATSPEPIDPRWVLQSLAERFPTCWTFSVDGLIGATPELLVRVDHDNVTSRVLAGTVRRDQNSYVDGHLAESLLASEKALAEHAYAVQSVADALAAHCTDLSVPEDPTILALANVQHLATDVTGRLADRAGVLGLAASLHPTAAVCGTPTERAFDVIRELEGMDRGRYAGPVGWLDARGDGEFGIALRCGQLDPAGTSMRSYAGCGIVSGSAAESEYAESEDKLLAMRSALSVNGQ